MRYEIKDIDICSVNERQIHIHSVKKNRDFDVLSGKYQKSKRAIVKSLIAQKTPEQDQLQTFNITFSIRSRKDPQNLTKILFDSLQEAQIISNDKNWRHWNNINLGNGKDYVLIDIEQNNGDLFFKEETKGVKND